MTFYIYKVNATFILEDEEGSTYAYATEARAARDADDMCRDLGVSCTIYYDARPAR